MADYQRTMAIEAPADDVFNFVSEVSNIPKYLPTVASVERQSGDRIRVRGEAGGQNYDDEGYFRVDKEARRMEWGSDKESNYKGWMQVEEGVEEVFTTRVTVHLSLTPRSEMVRKVEERGGDPDEVINESIDETLRSIKSHCEEAAADKSESQSAG